MHSNKGEACVYGQTCPDLVIKSVKEILQGNLLKGKMAAFQIEQVHVVVLGVILCLSVVQGDELVSWYYHSRSYSRLCYCSIYTESCYPNGCVSDGGCSIPLPKNYIARHLSGKTITIDGKLDDPAWEEVPWASTFDGKYQLYIFLLLL